MTNKDGTAVTTAEAEQSFSRVAQLAEQQGTVTIFQDGRPKYMLVDIDKSPIIEMSDDEKIDFVAARILKQHKAAFLELAK